DWRDHPSPRLRFLAALLDDCGVRLGRPGLAIYDAVAMTVALRPELATIRRLPLTVELAPGHHRGAVLVDRRAWGDPHPDWPRVDVVLAVDPVEHERLILELIT